MKKSLLTLVAVLALTIAASAQIVITEIMYNPPESGTDSLEYVELFNNSAATVDMSGWRLDYGTFNFTLPAGSTIGANAYRILAVKAAAMQNTFGIANAIQWPSGALSNNGATIKLTNAASNVIDEVTYDDAAPWPTDPDGLGYSLTLCDPNSDNAQAANWVAAVTATGQTINNILVYANPGAESACTGGANLNANDDNFIIVAGFGKNLTPLFNDIIPNPITFYEIVTPPMHGTVGFVFNNTINYTADLGYCGPDLFRYAVCDANGCDTATVNLSVICHKNYTIGQVDDENATGVADSLNVNCRLTGTVYGVNLRPVNNNTPATLFTLIDSNGDGIAVSSLISNFGYNVQEKDQITVYGRIGQFNGLTEIQPDTIIVNSQNNPLLAPQVVTALGENTESRLVKITNLKLVDPAEWTNGASGISGFNVRAVSDLHPLDTIFIRIDRDIETFNAPVPGQPFDLTGIGGQFDATSPYTSGYQVLPRYNADISTLSSTDQVNFESFVRLTPNPVNDLLTIQSDLNFDRIIVFSADGRIVETINNPALRNTLPATNWAAGIYFVRFEQQNAVWTSKVIKQ